MSGSAYVEVYRDRTGAYRWRLVGANHEIVATGEGHARASNAKRAFYVAQRICGDGVFVFTDKATARRKR